MKIAVGVIGLMFMVLALVQSCVVGVGGSIFGEENLATAGTVGVLSGILFGVGGAFAFKLPKVSIGIFAVITLFTLVTGLTTEYKDMIFYGIVAIVLLVLSILAHKRTLRESGHSS